MARQLAPEWALTTAASQLDIAEHYLYELEDHEGYELAKFRFSIKQVFLYLGRAEGLLRTFDRFVADDLDVSLNDPQIRKATKKMHDRIYSIERAAEHVLGQKLMQLSHGEMEPLARGR